MCSYACVWVEHCFTYDMAGARLSTPRALVHALVNLPCTMSSLIICALTTIEKEIFSQKYTLKK